MRTSENRRSQGPGVCPIFGQMGQVNCGVFGVLLDLLSANYFSLFHDFALINHFFEKKTQLFKEISIWLLGVILGCKRIKDLALCIRSPWVGKSQCAVCVLCHSDWNGVNLIRQKVSGDKSPLSPYVSPDLRTGGEPASARRGVGRSKMLSLAASKC